MERQSHTEIKRSLMARLGSWLRTALRKEQMGDPQWDEEVRREQTGKMGEDIHLAEDIRLPEDMRTSPAMTEHGRH